MEQPNQPAKEAHLEAVVEAAVGGHDLGQWERVTIFITPGGLWENPFIESFIGTLRRECLDRYLFDNHHQSQELLEWWREEYNRRRPHSSLGYQVPVAFASKQAAGAATKPAPALPNTESQLTLSF